MGELEEILGCKINRDLTKTTFNIYQPDITNNTTQGFNDDVKLLWTFNTPATPHKGIVCNQEIDTKISYYPHNIYISGILFPLYRVKQSRTELSNAVREHSESMDEENMSH